MNYVIEIFRAIYLSVFNVLLASVCILNFKPIYKVANSLFNINNIINLSSSEIYLDYCRIIDFINNPKDMILDFNNFTLSDNALYHFIEVRNIFIGIYIFILVGIIYFIYYLIKNMKERCYKLERVSFAALIIIVVLSLIIIIFSCVNFNLLFELFHEITFSNDYWIFDTVKDSIILALPEEFFLLCATMILILSIFLSVAEVVISKYINKKCFKEVK